MSDKCHCEEGLPEWIMSYADMITILMAFFVVMYSMAGSKDEGKEEAVMDSLRIWLGKYTNSELADLKAKLQIMKPPVRPPKHDPTPPKVGGKPTIESSRPLLFGFDQNELNPEQIGYLHAAASAMAGKMHWIEIRCEPTRRPLPGNPDRDVVQAAANQKIQLVMDYLASQGIEPSRIQTRVVPAYFSSNDALLRPGNDFQVDVFLLDQVYYPPGTVHELPPDPPAEKEKPASEILVAPPKEAEKAPDAHGAHDAHGGHAAHGDEPPKKEKKKKAKKEH